MIEVPNSYFQKNSHTLEKFFSLLIYSWLYTGFARVYLLQRFANYLYFIPYIILLFILFYVLIFNLRKINLPGIFLFTNFATIAFQILHVMLNDISVVTAFYGYCLYMMPVNLLFFISIFRNTDVLKKATSIIIYSIPFNVVTALLQTYTPNSFFARGIVSSDNVTSFNGFARAYGTFSAPAGFAVYLSMVTSLYILSFRDRSRISNTFLLLQITTLYIVSGSRTVFYALIVIILFAAFSSNFARLISKSYRLIKFVPLILLTVYIVNTYKFAMFEALLMRFRLAQNTENFGGRIFLNIFGFKSHLTDSFFGSGMGSYAIGNVGYQNQANWIEIDLIRNLAELGSLLGIAWIFFRFALLIYLPIRFKKLRNPKAIILFASISQNLLFGPIAGQSTISLACWICIFLSLLIKK